MEKVASKFRRNCLVAGVCVFLIASSIGTFAQSAAEKALLSKAQSLAASGHPELAVQTWQQVLLVDPNNQEALLGLAQTEMRLGKTDEARKYLDRLRAAGGNPADIARIEAMPSVQPKAEQLREAAQLAEQGKPEEAMVIYRRIFGDNPPPGDIALAYYDTEASIPADRPHAIEGLRRLSKQFPANSRYAVTLGRVLTYDPKTRAEGMAILRQYQSVPAAQQVLNQVESWGAKPAPAEGHERRARKPSPESLAYRALNNGNLDEARDRFQKILNKRPNNGRALSGMGYVAMKEQDFASAAEYFERAQTAGAKGLDSTLNTARFWLKMREAGDNLRHGNAALAADGYRSALLLKPGDADALEGLGGALAQSGDNAKAANFFEQATCVDPERASAWRGLFMAQSGAGNVQAALGVNDDMPKAVRAQLATDLGFLAMLVQDNRAAGHDAEADSVLEEALALPIPNGGRDLPADERLQYAALLMAARKYDQAIPLYQQAVTENPTNAEAWRALIAAQHQMNQDDAALDSVQRMPRFVLDKEQTDASFLALIGSIYQSKHELDQAQNNLEHALSLSPSNSVALQLADIYVAQGKPQNAYSIYRRVVDEDNQSEQAWRGVLDTLHQLNRDRDALGLLASMPDSVRQHMEQDPAYLQTLFSIQASAGQTQDALNTYSQLSRIYAERKQELPIGVQIQYGWILLKAGDDQKLYALVSRLHGSPEMTDDERDAFNRLWASWSIQRANAALDAGDEHRGVSILQAAEQVFPKNADVSSALAGAYLRAGQPKKAMAIYSSLDMAHASLSQYEGAIGAALAAGDMRQAQAWLETARRRFNGDPATLKLAAQYEEARGNDRRAVEYYHAALNSMGAVPTGGDSVPKPEAQQSEISPTQQSQTQHSRAEQSSTQQLMQLLVPGERAPPRQERQQKSEREQILDQLAAIEAANSGWAGVTPAGEFRSGQPGFDHLAAYFTPIEASAVIGLTARLTLIGQPVWLNSGTPNGTETLRQGTLPAGAIPIAQSANGVGGEVQLRASSFAARIGYTPQGFLVANVTGGILVHPPSSHFTLTLGRDPITDTQLSYAGLRDLGSRTATFPGNVWGGVITNAGEVQLTFGDGHAGWYIQAGGQYITGKHVQDNSRFDGDAGAYWSVWHRPEYGSLTLGMNFFGMHYDHDLLDFTYGQGGYFSPAFFVLGGMPVTLNGHKGPRFHYRVAGSIGVQGFREDSSPFFPLDPAIQAANGNPFYPEQTDVGANYSLNAECAYAISEHWYAGGYSNFNNARDYASEEVGFFVRYVFHPQHAKEESGPTGMFPAAGFRPFKVP